MKLTINLTPEEHAALADFLITPFGDVVDPATARIACAVLTKLVNQGAVIHGANVNHPSVKLVFAADYASFRPRKTLLPRAHRLGGPGSTR